MQPEAAIADLSDEALLRQSVEGDEVCFAELYHRHHSLIYRYAASLSSRERATEITQEVFLVLIRKPSRYDPTRGELAPYLLGIARILLLRCLQKEARFVSLPDDAEGPRKAGDDALSTLISAEAAANLEGAIRTLPIHYAEAVALCDLQERSVTEAARLLGCAPGTVASRLHRAHELLRQKLAHLHLEATHVGR